MTALSDYLETKLPRLPPSEQRFIYAARNDRVYWRGEEIEHFKDVYEETQRMRSTGPQQYQAQAVRKLKALVGAMT